MRLHYYNISEAAAVLGVSRITVSRWVGKGRLPVARLGHRTIRYRREDLELFLAKHRLRPLRAAMMPVSMADWGDDDASLRPEHVVQFYEADEALISATSAYIGGALGADGVGITIATEAHRRAIENRLRADGFDLEAVHLSGQYIALDASETLERLIVDDEPDAERFADVIGAVIARATEGGRPVRAFGEMVALLAADGRHAPALRLESLWNGGQHTHRFSLLCAYPMEVMGRSGFSDLLGGVCEAHGRIIPTESFSRLDHPNARFREITRLQLRAASLEAEVAERRRIEARLRCSERELRDFIENATEGLHCVGPDGRILWANRAELELLGYTADEYIGRSIADFHADPDAIADILCRLGANEQLQEYPARLRAKGGSIKHVLINSNVYREDGRIIHAHCFTRDVTARKEAEDHASILRRLGASSGGM